MANSIMKSTPSQKVGMDHSTIMMMFMDLSKILSFFTAAYSPMGTAMRYSSMIAEPVSIRV